MGKKKPFIDKKKAETFSLVRRSQRDVGGYINEETGELREIPNEFILWPTGNNKASGPPSVLPPPPSTAAVRDVVESNSNSALSRAKKQLKEAGLIDECDYGRFLKPMTGDGVFISPDGRKSDNTMSSAETNGAAVDSMLAMGHDPNDETTTGPNTMVTSLDETVREVNRQYESVVLTTGCMDPEIEEALFDFEEGGFEEISDDFCFAADREVLPPDTSSGGGGGGEGKEVTSESNPEFDFDEHVKLLLEKAKREDMGGGRVVPDGHEAWERSANDFEGIRPLPARGDDDGDGDGDDEGDVDSWDREFGADDDQEEEEEEVNSYLIDSEPGIVPKLNPTEEKALCDKFARTLLEYDSDEIGDLDDQYATIVGEKPLEGDVHVDDAMEQFFDFKRDEVYMEGRVSEVEGRTGGSTHILVGRKLVPHDCEEAELANRLEGEGKIEDVLAEADEVLANPEMDLPPEEVLIDGKSYFTMKEQNPWDCESILSTYSNLDNNPAVIGRKGKRRQKKKNRNGNNDGGEESVAIPEDEPVQILLSDKTGLPLNVLPQRGGKHNDEDEFDDGELTFSSVNRGVARKKGETKEEKRLRKEMVKQEKQIARLQKKMMKEAFQDEFSKHAGHAVEDDIAGKSVFRL